MSVWHLGELVVVIIIIWCWTLNNGQALEKLDIRGKILIWNSSKVELTDWGLSSSNELSGDGKEALRGKIYFQLAV